MTFKLIIQLLFGVFSLNRQNMRWFNLKRILFCLFVFPIFISLFLVNHLFLLLDVVFFPHFIFQKIEKPIFIISAPRSATTFLFHSLAQRTDKYTCVKLWEIIFAPSILQKYLILGIFKLDSFVNSPLKRSIRYIEQLIFGDFKKIHIIGLELPEEDEGFLIWNLSTLYLTYFYSDSHFFKHFYQFDTSMNAPSRARIMKRYHNYIRRHNFVFNRSGTRQFLSKNPLMMNKVASLHRIFPDAQILNINRNLAETLPSTLELNRTIYSAFTSIPTPKHVEENTLEQLINWYLMAHENLEKHYPFQHLKIDFSLLVKQDSAEIQRIADFLELKKEELEFPTRTNKIAHKSNNTYTRLTKEEMQPILKKLPFMEKYCT